MAHVSGPCSTLPGSHHSVAAGMLCDNHDGRLATHRVQGETDSFGAEYADYCDACYAQHKLDLAAYAAEQATGCCDWCKSYATDLRNKRDWEEGSYGPVYRVCGACVKRQSDRLAEEFPPSDNYYDVDEGDYDDDMDLIMQYEAPDDEIVVAHPTRELSPDGEPPQGAKAYVDGKFVY